MPWEDVHFWSGAQKNNALEEHETLNLTEQGYELLHKTWGPSLLRRLDVQLNGYAWCMKSDNPIMRNHKSRFYRKQCGMLWTLLKSMDRFAPNGIVRRRVRKIDEKYRQVIGQPSAVMQTLSTALEGLATAAVARERFDPANMRPKQEPFKRYKYDKNGRSRSAVPYTTEWPGRTDLRTRLAMTAEEVKYSVLDKALRTVRFASPGNRDPLVDEFLVDMVKNRSVGFGF